MPKFLPFVLLAALCGGIFPILNNRNVQILGPGMTTALLNIFFLVFSVTWVICHPREIYLVDRKTFLLAALAVVINLIGLLSILHAYTLAPDKLSIITITASFSIVILAIVNHFLGKHLQFHQWLGAVVTFVGIILINWKKP